MGGAPLQTMTHDRLLVGGKWVEPSTTELFPVVNPHTEQQVGSFPAASSADVDRAVAAARHSFEHGPWRRLPPSDKAEVFTRLAELFRDHAGVIAEMTTIEMGCPITQSSLINGMLPQMQLDWIAGYATQLQLEEERTGPRGKSIVRREPVGVVAAIVPWNGPIYLALNKVLASLLAGCSVVLKPAPEAALGLLHLGSLFAEAGVPDGVVSVVPAGRAVGEHLVTHQDVDRVSFTGSTASGRRIATLCAERFKRCGLELGGKSAAIVLDDADLSNAIEGFKFATMANTGQICALQTRLLVSQQRHDELVDALVDMVGGLTVGDPSTPGSEVGPLVAQRQRERVEGFIVAGQDAGAKVVLGGGRPVAQPTGWYVEPTIFTEVTNDMRIAREEIFGPVLSVITYRDEDEAIAIANDSDYGLAGSVWTADVDHGLDLAKRVRAGSLGVNTYGSDVNVPFGGFKASGIGREGGPEGIDEYFELQSIAVPAF